VGLLSLAGMPLDSRGLYRLLPWVPSPGNWPDSISLGLDLKGGVYVEYEASLSPEQIAEGADYATLMEATQQVMVERLSDKGFAEATVTQIGESGIRVEIPDVKDPQAVLDLIGTPAKLEFADPNGNIFMDGSYVQTASQSFDEENKPCIQLILTKQGVDLFGDMTARSIGQEIAIYLDDELLMSPTVESAIYGPVQISGDYTVESAANVAMQLQSGALPMDLRQDKLDTISATLGQDALDTSVTAAMIGIVLVMLIMLVRYRVCGAVAAWALCIYIIALFFLIRYKPSGKELRDALPYSFCYFSSILLLLVCFCLSGVVFGNILQSGRGIISIILGIILLHLGWEKTEGKVPAKVWIQRLLMAFLMLCAMVLYVLNPGK
jgi:preprotein translocase subunit SecD